VNISELSIYKVRNKLYDIKMICKEILENKIFMGKGFYSFLFPRVEIPQINFEEIAPNLYGKNNYRNNSSKIFEEKTIINMRENKIRGGNRKKII
jgi:hypothetical protein